MSATLARRIFSIHDYARMREAGILTEDDRVELLHGEIFLMRPISPLHIALVNRLNKLPMQQVGDDAIVSIQSAVQLDDYSEPQPDVALLNPRDDYYAQALARPDDILLIIEVADSSLDYDREQKLPRYAAASIPEVWIIDVSQRLVEQYSRPAQGQYTQLTRNLYQSEPQSIAFPGVRFSTDQLFR